MPDSTDTSKLLPPSGDPHQAEKYISQLIQLINDDKLQASHTDLSRFDPSSLQDHYRLDLKDYVVEVSHTKHPDSGKDAYVLLFTNLQQIRDGCTEKIILAYMHLDDSQFSKFKHATTKQMERRRKEEEEKRLNEALQPIDQILEKITNKPEENSQTDSLAAQSTNYSTKASDLSKPKPPSPLYS